MTSKNVAWNLPSAVIESILLKCPFKDLASSRMVCRLWNQIASGDQFWKKYFCMAVDMGEMEKGVLIKALGGKREMLQGDGNDGVESFLLKSLVITKSGFATLKGWDMLEFTDAHKEAVLGIFELLNLSKLFQQVDIQIINRSTQSFVPLIFPYALNMPFEPVSIAEQLGASDEMPLVVYPTKVTHRGPWLYGIDDLAKIRRGSGGSFFNDDFVVFELVDKANCPSPLFLLKLMIPGIVAGFISGFGDRVHLCL